MRIEKNESFNNYLKQDKKSGPSLDSFNQVINQYIKNKGSEDGSAVNAPSATRKELSINNIAYQSMRQIDEAGLKEFVKDAFVLTSPQILQEINALCNDETGENIDMKLLDELLELYQSAR